MNDLLLSVLIPMYNEEEFIGTVLDRVLAAPSWQPERAA